MADKIVVNPTELTGITSSIQSIIQELVAVSETLTSIQGASYYLEGEAKGQVGMFGVTSARMDELISHYERLSSYVAFASETIVEVDQSISRSVDEKK